MWGYIKELVYAIDRRVINNRNELWARIEAAFAHARNNPNLLTAAVQSIQHRLQLLFDNDGGYIEQLLRDHRNNNNNANDDGNNDGNNNGNNDGNDSD